MMATISLMKLFLKELIIVYQKTLIKFQREKLLKLLILMTF